MVEAVYSAKTRVFRGAHLLIGILPNLSVSKVVQYIEGEEFAPVADGVCSVMKEILRANLYGCGAIGWRVLEM